MTTPHDDAVTAATGARGPRRRLLVLLVVLTVGVLLLDQGSKAWALSALDQDRRVTLIGQLLGLRLVFNTGAALSIATGMTWVLTLVALGVVVVVLRVSRRLGSTGWTIALGLLLGGALGNLVDRIVREPGIARGHVVDFIAYADVFVGNVADIAIVVAAGLVMLQAVRGVRIDGSREPSRHDDTHDRTDAAGAAAEPDASHAGRDAGEPPTDLPRGPVAGEPVSTVDG